MNYVWTATFLAHSATLLVAGASLGAQTPTGWFQVSAGGPSDLANHAMAFDSARARTVLFGGIGQNTTRGNTWAWDGSTWSQAASNNPSARAFHAMAFDAQRGRIVLFGGTSNGGSLFLGDTWEWDGSAWHLASMAGPSARIYHAMAGDSQRGRVVLFGGQSSVPMLADTWEWDGSAWSLVASSGPPARELHSMAFSSHSARTVLFGGQDMIGSLGDTWEWDGVTWRPALFASHPPARYGHSMAYDSLRNRIVLFGGIADVVAGQALVGDTWEWTGSTWLSTPIAGPSSRWIHAMVFDSVRNRTVMVGGDDGGASPNPGTWERASFNANSTPFGVGCGQAPLVIQTPVASRPVLGSTLRTNILNISGVAAFMAIGFSSNSIGPFQLPVVLDSFGMTGCWLYHDAAFSAFDACTVPVSGSSNHDLPIPSVPSLSGVQVFLQAWADAPGANPSGVVTSNALALVLGDA